MTESQINTLSAMIANVLDQDLSEIGNEIEEKLRDELSSILQVTRLQRR